MFHEAYKGKTHFLSDNIHRVVKSSCTYIDQKNQSQNQKYNSEMYVFDVFHSRFTPITYKSNRLCDGERGMWNTEWLCECMERTAPRDLPRC